MIVQQSMKKFRPSNDHCLFQAPFQKIFGTYVFSIRSMFLSTVSQSMSNICRRLSFIPVGNDLKDVHWRGNRWTYFQKEITEHQLQQSYFLRREIL